MATVRIIGPGRAGSALALALGGVGWEVDPPVRRGDDMSTAAIGVDLLVIATPDAVIGDVSEAVMPAPGTVVAHMAGSLGLDVLGTHHHRASLHPLVSMPRSDLGAQRLRAGAWFAVAANTPGAQRQIRSVVDDLGGNTVEVPDAQRATYHAAACIASNHLVALLAHAERVASAAGVPLAALFDLIRGTIDNVETDGTKAALTGPVARGDEATIARHREAIPPDELTTYDAMVAEARRLVSNTGGGVDA